LAFSKCLTMLPSISSFASCHHVLTLNSHSHHCHGSRWWLVWHDWHVWHDQQLWRQVFCLPDRCGPTCLPCWLPPVPWSLMLMNGHQEFMILVKTNTQCLCPQSAQPWTGNIEDKWHTDTDRAQSSPRLWSHSSHSLPCPISHMHRQGYE